MIPKIQCEECGRKFYPTGFYLRSDGRIRQPCKECAKRQARIAKMKRPALWPPTRLSWLTPLEKFDQACSNLEQKDIRLLYAETITFGVSLIGDPHQTADGDDPDDA